MGQSIAIIASESRDAQLAAKELSGLVNIAPIEEADVIVALGGDGFMLQTMHESIQRGLPIFGMHRGTVGFLMNSFSLEKLQERIEKTEEITLHPLLMTAVGADGEIHQGLAINEISLLRETRQAAKLRISVDGRVRMPELICDGALVATPAGSTAYNLSAHGPILPLGSQVLALTPISAFRPRRWRGAILGHEARVRFDILEGRKRPVSAVADGMEVRDVRQVEIKEDRDSTIRLLFDPGHALDERILQEQFTS